MTRRKIEYWVIPPQSDAEFVASMEQVLDLYQKPYDPDCPVVCMDEQPVQLVKETRAPMAATKNRPRRVDYEYERAGTASVFLFSEPLAGWRQATARARRTKVDWALEVAGLLEGRYADCEKITLVCDNLNTHTKGAFYKVFEPTRARQLVRRIEFCYTPKHGSWLNIAENELSSLTRQCVRGRRIGDLGTLHGEVSAWSTDVNPSLPTTKLNQFRISGLRRQKCPSGTTNAYEPGKLVGQTSVLRTPPGCGSTPSAS